ncbi:hypothetical protein L9F63_004477, partial [Diploptera punctata]
MEAAHISSNKSSDSEDSVYDDPIYCKPRIVDVLKKSNQEEEIDEPIVVDQQRRQITTIENIHWESENACSETVYREVKLNQFEQTDARKN